MNGKTKYALGKCNCEAVSFEILCPISEIYICHCSICRAYSGSSNFAVVVIPDEQFNWTSGKSNIRTWKKPGHAWEAHFCITCGSALPGENDATRIFVPAGLIHWGGENLKVAQHVCIDSRASWEDIPKV